MSPAALAVADVDCEIAAVVQKPIHAFFEAGQIGDALFVEQFHSNERQEADQRPCAEGDRWISVIENLVVVEAIVFIPEPVAAEMIDGVHDLDEMLEELRSHVFIGRDDAATGPPRQFEGHVEHGESIKGHPCGAVCLFESLAARQGGAAVEDADVVEAEKASCEEVSPLAILAVDPPCEVQQQLLEAAFEELAVALAGGRGDLVDAPAGPCVHGRVDVAEFPFVGGDLAVRVQVPFAQEQEHLILGEIGICLCEGQHVEGGVPCGEPWVLPFVRHG